MVHLLDCLTFPPKKDILKKHAPVYDGALVSIGFKEGVTFIRSTRFKISLYRWDSLSSRGMGEWVI